MQHLSTRRGNIRPCCFFLQTVALCVILLFISVAEAQNNSLSCDASQQPIITDVNPPSGTADTTYRINGENLNETRSILAIAGDNGDVLETAVETENGYNVTLAGNAADSLVTIIFVPAQDGCVNATFELAVLRGISVNLIADPLVVQPGTIATTRTSSCLPPDCGDNSTDYEVIVNGHQLQKFFADRLGFVVRFPDTNVSFPPSPFSIQTSYSLLTSTGDRVMFVGPPPIASISPTMGQRGTKVVIDGNKLGGYGEGTKNISRVVIGGSPANISYSNTTHIFARLNSGVPNSTSIRINTTQTISRLGDYVFDGPYAYSNALWTQLEDGVVTELLPPAAQIGKTLTICGERLLGGGNTVTAISIAGQTVVFFSEVGPNQNLGGPSECINATVPDIPNPQDIVSGSIVIEADTGALVESLNNTTFTYANITSINPTQGQVGTEVTITGIELLSGYSDLEPIVFLSDVEATVLSASGDTVIVRVEDPGSFHSNGSGNFLSPDRTGDVVVTVIRDGQDYNVYMSDGWTYLEAGVIEQVKPEFGQIGTRINITGTNLRYGSYLSRALIANTTAAIISHTDTSVVLDAPDVPFLGFVDIVLVSDNGARVSRDQAFEYRERGIITGLNPSSGQTGTIVVISGSNLFGHADNVSEVTFGGIQAEIDYTQSNNTEITVRIQSNNVSSNTAVPVVITGSTLARVSSSGNDWTYLGPGSINDISGKCLMEVNSGIQWQSALEGTTVYRPCSDAGSMFRPGPEASRRCNDQGNWEEADLTSCTLTEVEEPFLLVWFVIEADEYRDSMEQGFVDSMKHLLDMNGVVYKRVSLQSAYIASVSVTFQVDLEEGDQSENITQLSMFLGDVERFSTFSDYNVMEDGRGVVDISVAEICMCSSADLGSSLQLCSGAAISPCNCMDSNCSCQSPFVGDGISCTLDSDSDGYPDQALDSPTCTENPSLVYCTADVCPEVTNPDQDPMACQPDATLMQVHTGCPYGPDDVWNIIWPNTPGGSISSQPCPGGVDAIGTATRMCYENGTWGTPDVLSCQSLEIVRVSQEASARLPDADAEIEDVTPELIEATTVISEQLVMATDREEAPAPLLPLDLNTTNNVVAQVLNVLESSVEGIEDNTVNEELVEVFNNILNETNQAGWLELQSVASGSQTLLQNAEQYGTYLAGTVNNTGNPVTLVRENIIVNAEVVDTSNVSDIVFPAVASDLDNFTAVEMNNTAQITIPAGAITALSAANSSEDIAVVHIIFRNIEEFLPTNTSILNNSRSASLVISSQFRGFYQRDIPDNVFMNNPIILNFTFTESTDGVINYAGVFWNFSDPVGSGEWSSEGIQVISNITRGNVTTVLCNSTHLTGFAVLVDVAGGLEGVSEEEKLALQITSYIGCIISTICLSITVVFYLAMGKKLFSSVHYFVHLNLAISLLLGYIVFIFGIELGTSSKDVCTFVAALLQYLFLSAFCWMMCEGVMLYLMLIVVFSKLSNKWWFFMLLGYCTPLVFVVVGLATRSDYYGVRGEDGELAFCWLSTEKGTILAFVAPMIIIIIINSVFLVLALVALVRSKKQKAKTTNKDKSTKQATTILRATIILLPLLGLTWLFGLLTLNENTTVFAWLFTIFNSLQGAGLFYFHVVRSEKVWSKVSPRLSSLKQRLPKSSLKYNSMSYTSSTDTMRTLLHKNPIDEYSGQKLSSTTKSHFSWSVSEGEMETGIDSEKKPLEPIPEGDVKGGDLPSASGVKGAEKGVVICNPDTVDRGRSEDEECDKQE